MLAALTGLAWLMATFVIITGAPGHLLDAEDWAAFWGSSFGTPWGVRLGVLAGCAILASLPAHRATLAAFALLGAALAVDQAWLGHAATGTGRAGDLMLAADALHALAALAWTGALPMLGLLLASQERRYADRALDLFATLGLVAVSALLATGVLNASFRIASALQLVDTPYGRIVSLKLGLFAAMLLLAWTNRRNAGARLSRRLAWGVALETGFGLLVLCAAALLGVTEPPT